MMVERYMSSAEQLEGSKVTRGDRDKMWIIRRGPIQVAPSLVSSAA
jgi:hypothetical protein